MLIVEYPADCTPEIEYVFDVILGDFLGLSYTKRGVDNPYICLRHNNHELVLNTPFFSALARGGPQALTHPVQPLKIWDADQFEYDIKLTDRCVPVILGKPYVNGDDNRIEVGIDIFGSIFYLLSGCDEIDSTERDNHDRFPAKASLAYRCGFLDRPIVDEYVEILWACMKRLWPAMTRKKHSFHINVTADVDRPYSCGIKSIKKQVKQIGADLIKRRSPKQAVRNMVNYFVSKTGDYRMDPFYPEFEWMMDTNERAGNKILFYFEAGLSSSPFDGCYTLDEPVITDLIQLIISRGHTIGLHPSYHTYKNASLLSAEVTHLLKVLEELGANQTEIGGRQHFLRWRTLDTMRSYEQAGLIHDSTLGFADMAGFRCGTCQDFPLFDVEQRKSLRLRENPLIVMEDSIINYMGLGYTEAAQKKMLALKETCRLFDGKFTLLWHNSSFRNPNAKEIYEAVISG